MSRQKKSLDRRDFLMNSLAAAGTLGLRSLVLGLPPMFLTQRAMAAGQATYLIYSCYSEGCPLNANAPGSYQPGVTHAGSFNTPVSFTLGTTNTQAAAPWANLPALLRNRMNFIHHDSRTNAHSEADNVLKVHGALKGASGNGAEMLPSAIAQMVQSNLGTLGTAPILVGQIRGNLTFNSIPQPFVAPNSLTQLFPTTTTPSANSMRQFRDRAVDTLYRDLRSNGTPAQKKFLDDHVLSASQARNLLVEFQSTLSGLGTSTAQDQMIAAAALIAAKATPSIVINLRFGGDNHGSSGVEEQQTTESVAAIGFLWDRLNAMGLHDKTTFCIQNVFGRTLVGTASGGRQHHGGHNVAVMFGPNVKPGITGQLQMSGSVGRSTAINSTTGTSASADVPTEETLAATAKTLMKACGADETTINQRIAFGKILRSAVV